MKVATLLFGLGIVGAAFAMPWGAEAAEHDIPRALALITVALLAILPEYAGDIIFAWKAGGDSAFAAYAFANMTGFNRVLLGLSWPTVAVLTWAVRRQPIVRLDRSSVPGLLFLGLTTLYSFWLPRKATISLIDSVVLIGLFIAYAALAARSEMVEPVLAGPAAAIEALPSRRRRTEVIGLFAYAAAAVAVSAEAFADGLVRTGRALGEEGDAAEFRYSLGHRKWHVYVSRWLQLGAHRCDGVLVTGEGPRARVAPADGDRGRRERVATTCTGDATACESTACGMTQRSQPEALVLSAGAAGGLPAGPHRPRPWEASGRSAGGE